MRNRDNGSYTLVMKLNGETVVTQCTTSLSNIFNAMVTIREEKEKKNMFDNISVSAMTETQLQLIVQRLYMTTQ